MRDLYAPARHGDGVERGAADPDLALEVGADRDRVRHILRSPRGQGARVVAAAAVAHERDALPAGPPQRERLALHALERTVRAVGVGDEASRVGPVADAPQPQRQDGESLVAGTQAGGQQDRAAVAVRHARAAEHRVDDEAASSAVQRVSASGRPHQSLTPGAHAAWT
jgi:hypothetical protein